MSENNTNNTNNTNNNENNNGDILRSVMMAGLGAVSFTVEKTKDLISALIKKGEKTAEDNDVSYEEVRDRLTKDLRDIAQKVREEAEKADFEELLNRLDELTDEQRAIARDRIDHPLRCDETANDACEGCPDPSDCDSCDKACDKAPDDETKE